MGALRANAREDEMWQGAWCWWAIGQTNRWIKNKLYLICNYAGRESISVMTQALFPPYIKDGE